MKQTIAIVLGTRPEVIKLAPIIIRFRESQDFHLVVIASGQHREMSRQAFSVFDIKPDIDLDLMKDNQQLNEFVGALLTELDAVFSNINPKLVLVQGDTSTALSGALASFHRGIPVAHVEAGLRTYDMSQPFPEEMNRQVISRLSTIHFCPTAGNAENLRREGICRDIHLVGNSGIDALNFVRAGLVSGRIKLDSCVSALKLKSGSYILVTGHRRENLGRGLEVVCEALSAVIEKLDDVSIVFPVHRNPNVDPLVQKHLGGISRVHLLPPVDYPSMVYLMQHARLIVSDSGGMQEEAPSLGVPLIVTRKTTERPEAIDSGGVFLGGLDSVEVLSKQILYFCNMPLDNATTKVNPFGDGQTTERIYKVIQTLLST